MTVLDQNPISFNERRKPRRFQKQILVLPSLLTAAALCSGFFSIIHSLNVLLGEDRDFGLSVFAIILATVFDSLDGRMARLMKAESEFGSHFDSIADVVSFGVAPAVLVYAAALGHLGRVGWAGSFLFVACAAIRLARFNVAAASGVSKKYFKGLSSPVAAGGCALSMYVLFGVASGVFFYWGTFLVTVFLALLMVSNVRFRSFKDLQLRTYPIQVFLSLTIILVLVMAFREVTLFGMFIVYLLSGLIEELVLFRRRRKSDPKVPFLPFGEREETQEKNN